MRRMIIVCALLLPRLADASDEIPIQQLVQDVESKKQDVITKDQPKTLPGGIPGAFTTLGSYGRMWELRSDTAFSTTRVFTERVELAHMIGLAYHTATKAKQEKKIDDERISPRFGVVLRTSFGIAADTSGGMYNPAGPIFGLGFRTRTESDNEWIELGARVIPNYPGPENADPGMIKLAQNATTSSGIADDAAWLPLSSFGAQLYLLTQARTELLDVNGWKLAFGAWGGGYASLGPLEVTTWLGPQRGFVGNMFLELFFTLQQIGKSAPLNLQIGAHGEASLSSCWPGNDALPVLVSGFIAWSPVYPVAVRVFYGTGGSALAGNLDAEYGARLQLYFP